MILPSSASQLHDFRTRLAKVMRIARMRLWQAAKEHFVVNLELPGDFDLTFFLLAV